LSQILAISMRDLLNRNVVESTRIEYKASWDEKTTGWQILKTICAFANDLQNLNGGYIVIGVCENNGAAVLPPAGIDNHEIGLIQKWIRGHCNRIDPEYQPVFSPEIIDDKTILVIWVPPSDIRPHLAPDGEKGEKKYFVRIGSETVDAARNGVLDQLIQLTAKVPFDDRRNNTASIEDIRETKVREFLKDIGSGLLEQDNAKEIYRRLRISVQVNGHDAPKNIGLLFFSEDPEIWFSGARIEVVQFADGSNGNIIEEKYFRGGLHEQLKNALNYIETLSQSYIEKQDSSYRAKGWISFPVQALRETVVNAVYHRGYDFPPEPVKVYLYPDRMEIISYPGPVPGINSEQLNLEKPLPFVPARNRRIGEFLKELKLAEGRGTGLPKLYRAMKENGSGKPIFKFDENRTYFQVTLPAHPEYIAISAVRDAAHLRAIGNIDRAYNRIKEAWNSVQDSPSLTAELIRILGEKGNYSEIEETYSIFKKQSNESFIPFVTNTMIDVFLNANKGDIARKYLRQLPEYLKGSDSLETAILARRMGEEQSAHRYFERAGDVLFHDPKALHEFAQTKMKISTRLYRSRKDPQTEKRLLIEAKELLEKVIQMEADKTRHAWAWRDLASVKNWLKLPYSEVTAAYENAINLLPSENTFKKELELFKSKQESRNHNGTTKNKNSNAKKE